MRELIVFPGRSRHCSVTRGDSTFVIGGKVGSSADGAITSADVIEFNWADQAIILFNKKLLRGQVPFKKDA